MIKKVTIKYILRSLTLLVLTVCIVSGMIIDFNSSFGFVSTLLLGLELICAFIYLVCFLKKTYLDGASISATLFVFWSVLSCLWSSGNLYDSFDRLRYIFVAVCLFYIIKKCFNSNFIIHIMNYLFFLQIINFLLTVYQKEFLGLHPDFCNGIFGSYDYFNSSQGIFALLISCLCVVHYINNSWDKWKCISGIILSFVTCALSEVKAFFVVFVIDLVIIALAQLKSKVTRRRVIIILTIAVMAFGVAWKILSIIMPENLKYFTNINLYFSYEEYGARGGVGRLNQFSYVYENVFNSSFFSALIGKGLGSATGYYVYEFPVLFHEEGLVGILLFTLFLMSCVMSGYKLCKKNHSQFYGIFLIVWSINIFISLFLWNAAFAKPMPIIFIFLGAGYLGFKRNVRNNEEIQN